MNKEFNLIEAIRVLLKWKFMIAGVTVVSGIAAALVAVFVLDEQYLSYSTFYPTNQALAQRQNIFNNEATQLDYFGDKTDVNRLLTIANSIPVIESVIDSFNIAEHYKIDTAKKYWRTTVRKKFEKKYKAIKTEHEAVEISLYDTDPKLAATIVNTVVDKVDRLNKQHVQETNRKLYELIKAQTTQLQSDVYGNADTLATLGEQYKIKVSSGADGTTIVEGNDYKAVQLYKAFNARQLNASRELNNMINIKGQLEVAMRSSETSLFVLEKAIPADRREKPVRSLVVLITMIVTLFVSIIGVLLIEQVNEIKQQL